MADYSAIALAAQRLRKLQLQECLDPNNPETRPTPTQQTFLQEFGTIPQQWIVASNQSGKSAICLRNLAWFLKETHPYWQRRPEWKKEPLLAIVCGRTGKQIEELAQRLIAFFDEEEYKVVRMGNQVQRIEMSSGSRVIFQSLENPHQARERVQSYVAHLVWLDEMPQNSSIIGELLMRVQARNGYFMASFTPLEVNLDIKRMVESAELPLSKKYKLLMFDNPVYADPGRREAILKQYAHLSESERNARLFGDWYVPSSRVYHWDPAVHCRELPPHYSRSWRHVESVDPAISSRIGYALAAEDPGTGDWYLVKSKYIEGMNRPARDLVEEVIRESTGYHIVKRIYDPAASWWYPEARLRDLTYIGPYDKVNRKHEFIKGLQAALGTTFWVPSWNQEFIAELTTAQWADSGEGRIANSQRLHVCDAVQYMLPLLPKFDGAKPAPTWQQELREANAHYQNERARIEMVRMNRRGRSKWQAGVRRVR